MSTSNLLVAIRVVKNNERIASEKYADAANKIDNQMGKELFKQLSAFENFHYERLTTLEKSLQEKGDFISYEGKEFPLPAVLEVKAAKEPEHKTALQIISEAIDLEQEAEKAYADLAAQITEPLGHNMFRKLSEEEHKHYLLLREAHWSLTNSGVWNWSPP